VFQSCSRGTVMLDSLCPGRCGDRIPLGDEIFRTHPDRPWGPRRLCTVDTLSLSLGQSGRGTFTTHTYLAPKLKKEYRYTSAPPLGLHGLLQGELFNSAAT